MTWYTDSVLYDTLLLAGLMVAILILIGSRYGAAQYGGRFGLRAGGLKISSKAGWMLMEIPALVLFPIFFFMGERATEAVPLFFLAIWTMHYLNRALITPLLMRTRSEVGTFDISVVVAGWLVLALHSYLNARYISEYGEHYQIGWFADPRFWVGLIMYAGGFLLNVNSDAVLRNLRSKNPTADEPRYKIPYGGGFQFVTCPQYLGEMIAFAGFAIMVWHLGAVFVLVVTVANLLPRALHTHSWFKKNFATYPEKRKALIPFIL